MRKLLETRPILIIDSGKGGLNVLKKLSLDMKSESFIFFADTEFLPYGNKNPKELIRRSNKIISKIKEYDPKIIILACNTLDSIAGDIFESNFPTISVVRIIKPSAKKALELSKSKNIALLATTNTVDSKQYISAMIQQKNVNLYAVECQNLAMAIENNENLKETLINEISPLKEIQFDVLILGCTHYSYVKNALLKKYENVIDSADIITDETRLALVDHLKNRANDQKVEIIMTSENEKFKKIIESNFSNSVITQISLKGKNEKNEKN